MRRRKEEVNRGGDWIHCLCPPDCPPDSPGPQLHCSHLNPGSGAHGYQPATSALVRSQNRPGWNLRSEYVCCQTASESRFCPSPPCWDYHSQWRSLSPAPFHSSHCQGTNLRLDTENLSRALEWGPSRTREPLAQAHWSCFGRSIVGALRLFRHGHRRSRQSDWHRTGKRLGRMVCQCHMRLDCWRTVKWRVENTRASSWGLRSWTTRSTLCSSSLSLAGLRIEH